MGAQKENPPAIGVVAGQGSYEKLRDDDTTQVDAISLLREAQAVVSKMMLAADRLAASIAKAVSP